jgi:hypothetical protein
MIRTYRAELARITRPRTVVAAMIAAMAFSIASAIIVTTAAKSGTGGDRAVSVARLVEADGGTHVFRLATSFAGTFLFVVFVGITAVEFSRGTIRTMLLRQPRRTGMLAGRLGAQLTFAAATLALTEVATWIAARLIAPAQGIATGAWTSLRHSATPPSTTWPSSRGSPATPCSAPHWPS